MYRLTNISRQHVILVKVSDDYKLTFVRVKPREHIDIDTLSDYINVANLLGPHVGIFEISFIN